MQRKNVLGSDPLSWLKENKEEKQEKNVSEQEKQSNKPHESKDDESLERREYSKQDESSYEQSNETEVQKNIYDPSSAKEQHKVEEDRDYEPSDVTEINRKAVLDEKAYAYNSKYPETTQKESPATAFVIVYTVLLLILGFIVYRDLTKRIDRLDTKLKSIEKQVETGSINYGDSELGDMP